MPRPRRVRDCSVRASRSKSTARNLEILADDERAFPASLFAWRLCRGGGRRRRAGCVAGPPLDCRARLCGCAGGGANSASLPLPSSVSVAEYERQLFEFLNQRQYQALGWARDKGVRDTGPFRNGKYYGTHPAVRVYYSPEIIAWLSDGRRGAIPDGAMIIKEQYEAPAARYDGIDEDELWRAALELDGDGQGLRRLARRLVLEQPGQGPEGGRQPPVPVRPPGLRLRHLLRPLPCLDQDAPARPNEFTFASLRNIAGFPGRADPVRGRRLVAASRQTAKSRLPTKSRRRGRDKRGAAGADCLPRASDASSHPRCTDALQPELCTPRAERGVSASVSRRSARGRATRCRTCRR